MKNFVISIGRQFGCSANEIAQKLSKRLNVPYYDKEIIKRAAKDSGFDENIFVFYDERPTRSFLYNVSSDAYSTITSNGITLEDKVFQYQFDAIRKAAEEGSCIIVGRCADYILKDRPDLLTVFLHADIDYRKNAVIEKYGIDEKSALKEIKATDKKRARFHNFYSDEKWGEADTYDLCINVAKIGIDKTVDLIEEYIKSRYS
ncbi:MAG: AAA family ATPase [Eubacterium sp.]